MNGSGRYFLALLAANVIVTLSLLVFAWCFRGEDKSIATLVVGALLAHWFRESGQLDHRRQRDRCRSRWHRRARILERARFIESFAGTVRPRMREVALG